MSLGTTYSPTNPVGGAISYKLWRVLTYSNAYWEVYRRFQGDFLVGGGVDKRGICWGNFPSRNLSRGKKISMKGAQDFLALFKKKQWKNKYEKFFQLEVRSSIKTQNEQKLLRIWGAHLFLIPRSLRLSIFSDFNYLFYGFCDSGFILNELWQNLIFSVKSEVLTRGWTPHICNKNMRLQKFVT